MSVIRHVRALGEAWRDETERRRTGRKAWLETEFLPAALEVTETPPSPTGRILLWVIIAAALLAIAWACLAEVDTVAVAEGRLTPTGRLRTVEAADPGVVRQIAVREGDHVQAGQLLVALDPTVAQADVQTARSQLETAALARARANALLGAGGGRGGPFDAPSGAAAAAVQAEKQAVEARLRELQEHLAGLQARRTAGLATVRMSDANIAKLEQTIPLAQKQVNAYQTLADKGYGSQIRLDQEREREIGLAHDLDAERARREEAQAQVAALEREIAQTTAEFRSQAAKERAEAEGNVAARQGDLKKAQERSTLQALRAPVSGTVQEVAVTTLGQVAEAGKPLVTIVPEGEALVAEALVLNRDIGSVKVGDEAVVKLEAYPFTRYGVLVGRVQRISPDAIVDEKRGLVFPATITLSAERDPRSRSIRLSPGMSSTVEIVTGRRRVIQYLWSPVARATREAGRER